MAGDATNTQREDEKMESEIEQAKAAAADFDKQQEEAEAEAFLKRQKAIAKADKDAKLSAAEYTKAYGLKPAERSPDKAANLVLFVLPTEEQARAWCDKEKGIFALSYFEVTDIEARGASYVFFDDVSDAANVVIQDIQRKGATYAQMSASDLEKAQTAAEREALQQKGKSQVLLFKAEADRHNYSFSDIVAQIRAYSEQDVFVTKTFGGKVRFKPSAMSVIVARSNRGKSKALKSIAAEAILQGRRVLFFTLEELPRQVLEDVILSLYYESVQKYIGKNDKIEDVHVLREVLQSKRKASGALQMAIEQVQKAFQAHSVHINDSRRTADITQAARAMVHTGDIVLLDYLQLASTGRVMSDKFLRVETVAQELCALAKGTGCTLITAAQANRDGAKGEGPRVNGIKRDSLEAEHIRDSDAILHEADIVVGIGAEDSDGGAVLSDGSKERSFFKVLKNRQERVDRTLRELEFVGEYAYIRARTDEKGELVPFVPTNKES